jgi:hypothetical protein
MKGNCGHNQVLREDLMNDSASNRIQAVLLSLYVVGEVSVDVHGLRHPEILIPSWIILECYVIVIDALLPLMVIVAHSVGHGGDYDLT